MECCTARLIKTRNQPFKKEMKHLPLSLLTDGFCSLLPLNVTRHISTYTVLHLILSESKHKKGHVIDTFWL